MYAFTEAVDMRKSFNTLGALVAEQMKLDVLRGGVRTSDRRWRARSSVICTGSRCPPRCCAVDDASCRCARELSAAADRSRRDEPNTAL